MSDERRLTKDKRERWRVDLADDHPDACNPWDVEAALDECDALERERDEARRLVRYAIAPESPGEGRYMLPLVEAVTTWEGDDDDLTTAELNAAIARAMESSSEIVRSLFGEGGDDE